MREYIETTVHAEGEYTYQELLRAIHSMKQDDRFSLFLRHLRGLFDESRLELERADQNFRQQQGRVSCLRELLNVIDTAFEVSELIGQSEKSDPAE